MANTKFPNFDLLFDEAKFFEADICTLVPEFRETFTRDEWRKICWLKSRFSKTWDNTNVDFEEIIKKKINKYSLFKLC